ncbi:hypothetical protein LZ30DRAFT_690928 [Colletotrichum cereale]|nr:hypothetical protein LZ30DRAFT_690928 [Colletotrichum cereale]
MCCAAVFCVCVACMSPSLAPSSPHLRLHSASDKIAELDPWLGCHLHWLKAVLTSANICLSDHSHWIPAARSSRWTSQLTVQGIFAKVNLGAAAPPKHARTSGESIPDPEAIGAESSVPQAERKGGFDAVESQRQGSILAGESVMRACMWIMIRMLPTLFARRCYVYRTEEATLPARLG